MKTVDSAFNIYYYNCRYFGASIVEVLHHANNVLLAGIIVILLSAIFIHLKILHKWWRNGESHINVMNVGERTNVLSENISHCYIKFVDNWFWCSNFQLLPRLKAFHVAYNQMQFRNSVIEILVLCDIVYHVKLKSLQKYIKTRMTLCQNIRYRLNVSVIWSIAIYPHAKTKAINWIVCINIIQANQRVNVKTKNTAWKIIIIQNSHHSPYFIFSLQCFCMIFILHYNSLIKLISN